LVDADIVGTSGYRTSDYTEAVYIRAFKPISSRSERREQSDA
jgi:hypothetical protein